ncbi:MAG TPA: peptidylprolyl isomerase [Planctomycetota bacterium]|nr:peptidylprolyl isomerase [Planctomycetota bacterium]
MRTALASLVLLAAGAIAGPTQDEVFSLAWDGTCYRVGGPIAVRIVAPDQPAADTIRIAQLVMKASDGRERRLRSSATESKPRNYDGRWVVDVDASELPDSPPPGRFELTYEIAEGRRTKSLVGRLVQPIADPLALLAKEPAKVAALLETTLGPMLIELRPDKAPETVRHFVKLVSEGFYDGRTFHRIKRGFVIQGGAYKLDGTLDQAPTVKREISDLSHVRGAISMALVGNPPDPDSARSQFFICVANHRESLDKKYAAFGKVVEGLETVDRIAQTQCDRSPEDNDEKTKPIIPPLIRKATAVEKP